MEGVIFFIAAIGAVVGAIGVVAARNPFYSVLALIAHLFSLAVLFLLLTSAFVAAAQVVVYAGAVMVLYVFVVAYVGDAGEAKWDPVPGQRLFAGLLAFFLFVEISAAVLSSGLKALSTHGPSVPAGFGDPAAIGNLLLEKFLVPFEASSLLLLIAAVGAIVLANRKPREPQSGSIGGRPAAASPGNGSGSGGAATSSGHSAPEARPEGVAVTPPPQTSPLGAAK
ncbi:MAG TPA: NADH-quinone oxidoreductase subunit J [Solirubrobacterales bacterium]